MVDKEKVEIIDPFEHAPVVGERPGEKTGEGVLTVSKLERHVWVIVYTGDGDRHAISKVSGAGNHDSETSPPPENGPGGAMYVNVPS